MNNRCRSILIVEYVLKINIFFKGVGGLLFICVTHMTKDFYPFFMCCYDQQDFSKLILVFTILLVFTISLLSILL